MTGLYRKGTTLFDTIQTLDSLRGQHSRAYQSGFLLYLLGTEEAASRMHALASVPLTKRLVLRACFTNVTSRTLRCSRPPSAL